MWKVAAALGEIGDDAVKELANRLLGRLPLVRTWSLSPVYPAVRDSSSLAWPIREAVQRISYGGLADEIDDRK
jgi:hypothetical protein